MRNAGSCRVGGLEGNSSFAQRREQIVGDCCRLKTDVDHYNDIRGDEDPVIQLVLDFTEDVAEREIVRAA